MTTSPQAVAQRAESVKLRRSVGFLLMSALVPGSVQLFAGHRRVGAIALRIWAAFVVLVVLVLLGLWLFRGPTVGLLLNPWLLALGKIVAWAYAVGWVGLLIDSWRLADPLSLPRPSRVGMTLTTLALVLAMFFGTGFASRAMTAAQDVSEIFAGGGEADHKAGRFNILLLGADAGPSREGLRPDSMTVASIDAETGRTVLFSLPRNLERAPFPKGSPLHERYPDGYHCAEHACMLNGIYTLGMDHKDLYPGVADPGLAATTEAIEEILGLDINYYAMVDLAGFRALIDAMGGITLDVNRRIPIGGGSTPVTAYIEPGKGVHLDGQHALWFARSRHGSNDYERMARQKCVMSAMLKQLDPMTVASTFGELAKASKSVVRTDVGASQVSELADLALKAKSLKITSVSFAPPLIKPADPDFDAMRKLVADSIATSQSLDAPGATKAGEAPTTQAPQASATATASPSAPRASRKPTPAPTAEQTQRTTDDLAAVCAVS